MDVSYTNVLEVSRQYFQGLPVPSTAGTENLTTTTTTSTSFENGTATTISSSSSITSPAVASMVTTSNNRDQHIYSESKTEDSSTTSYWNPSGSNELRPVEPYPPQPTKVEVPDTRPDETAMEPGSLTEMLPSKSRTTEQKQEPSSTVVPATEPQLHQMQPPKSQSPVYQQLNNVARTSYPTADPYQDRSIAAQRVQYYPRYHHPDIRKSAPVPFSQNSMYVPPSASPTVSVQCIRSNEQGSIPTSSHSQQEQHRIPSAYSQPQTLIGGSSVYGTYATSQRRIGPSTNDSTSPATSLVNPHLGTSNPLATGSTSHIPSPHNIPAHIPSPHPPSGSSTSLSSSSSSSSPMTHSSRNPNTYRPVLSNQQPQSQRHSPHISVMHNQFQPHSPPYPPPPRSTPQTYSNPPNPPNPSAPPPPPTSLYQTGSNFPNPYSQSSYHSYQKTVVPNSSYYSQPPRTYSQPVEQLQINSGTNGGAYQNSIIKYNGEDVKRNPTEVTNYGSYRTPTPIQRNTHNLPPIGALSFQNRNSRDKSQALPRQRTTHSIKPTTVPIPSTVPRRIEYPVSSINQIVPINGRTTSYSRYNQQYPTYATTVAPSHYGSNSSSTTVTSIGVTRPPTAPTQYSSSDSTSRTQENFYKDYYQNSSRYSLPNGLRKRESPLDLSVKTVKTSADSTAQDDIEANSNLVTSSNAMSSRNMLPPVQTNLYPFDVRNTNGIRNIRPSTVCAPKVEFYPDFNTTRHQQPNQNSLRRSLSSQQLYPQQQQQQQSQNTIPLPHMSTFKKSLPTTQQHPRPYPDRPSDSSKYYQGAKFFSTQLPSDKYNPMKRGCTTDALYTSGSTPNKQPRVDAWRIAIDEQIQQKFLAARQNEEQKKQESNGYEQRQENIYSNDTRYQTYCDKRNYQDPKLTRPPSNNQPSGSQMDLNYLNYRQYSEPPSNTGADKRVLSLLRNSLESKQQREEQLNSQQSIVNQQSFQQKVVTPIEPKTNIGRHNLSPFTAASLLERNSNTPPHYKFHVPKAVDSIIQDNTRGLYSSKMNSILSIKETSLSPRGIDNNQMIIGGKDDGLAAKIRTKAELKQVGTGQFVSKPPMLLIQDTPSTPKGRIFFFFFSYYKL